MRRKITSLFIRWKNNPNKLPLIVKGTRQIGKTYSIKEFAIENYSLNRIIYINFEQEPDFASAFSGSKDYDTIMNKLSRFIQFKAIDFKDNPKNPLFLFLDEIQKCPDAITSLKFLSEAKDRCHIIASGSLLGLFLSDKNNASYPVGYVEHVNMYPFDFEEFMWARGYSEQYVNGLANQALDKNLSDEISPETHLDLMSLFREYIVIGGLPAAINAYNQSKTFPEVNKVLKNLYTGYSIDINKYMSKNDFKIRAIDCFQSIPNQLKQQNKKFKYSIVSKQARSREFENSLQWLQLAGLVIYCYNVKTLKEPLELFQDKNCFKLYCFDTGILLSMMNEADYYGVLNGTQNPDVGGIYENAVASILNQYYDNSPLMYYTQGQSMEVDFVIRNKNQLIPLEVKSGNNLKSPSLNSLSSNKDFACLKVSSKLVKETDVIKNIPFYMFALLFGNQLYK